MEYIKKDLASFGLHFIHTNKFKTITIRVVFHSPIEKKEILSRNLLTDILLQSSKNYETKRDMTIQAEDLYALDISTNNRRIGNYIFTSFSMQVLKDKYTEENNLEKSIEFLSEIILNPDVKNNAFKKDKFEIVKKNAEVTIDGIKEDKSSYAFMRMAEAYDKDSPISLRMIGYKEDLDEIDTKKLYESYKKMINNDFVDIYVVGEYNDKEMLSIIKKYFKFKILKKRKKSYYLEPKTPRKKILIAKERINNSQSKLCIACPVVNLTPKERDYIMILSNLILGGGTDSKLFKDVREKNSLCYSIYSIYSKIDSMLVISSGIDRDNYDKTVDLIKENLSLMKKGKITKKELETAKRFIETYIDEVEESPSRMINEIINQSILNMEPINTRIEKIQRVNLKEVIKATKKITIDTIFLLEGVSYEDN